MAPAPSLSDLNVDGFTGGPGDFPAATVSPAPLPVSTGTALTDLGISGLTGGSGDLPGHGGAVLPHEGAAHLTSSSKDASGSMLRRKYGLGAVVFGIALSVLSA